MHERLIQLDKQPRRILSTRTNRASGPIEPVQRFKGKRPSQASFSASRHRPDAILASCSFGANDRGTLTAHAYWIAGEQQLKKKPPLVADATTPAVNCNSSGSIFSRLASFLAAATCGDAAVSSGAGSTTSFGVGSSTACSVLDSAGVAAPACAPM